MYYDWRMWGNETTKPPLHKSGKMIMPVLLMPELTLKGILAAAIVPLTSNIGMTPNYESSCWKGSIKENQARAR